MSDSHKKALAQLTTEIQNLKQKNSELEFLIEKLRKQRDESIVEQELTAIINALPGLVSVVDTQFNTLIANNEVYRIFGKKGKAYDIGEKCYKTRKNLDHICPNCAILKAFETGEVISRISTPEEEKLMGIVTKSYAVPLFKDGKLWAGVEVILDITDATHIEKSLKTSERKYRGLLESALGGFFQADEKGNIILVNTYAEKILGYSREELMTMNARDLFCDSELNESPLCYDLAEEEKTTFIEREVFTKDKKQIQIELSVNKNADGTFQSFFHDITKRNREKLALTESEERYSRAFKTSPDAVNINNLDGTYVDINDGFTELTGYSREDTIGKKSLDLNIWADPNERNALLEGLTTQGRVLNFEMEFRKKNGLVGIGLMSAVLINIGNVRHILSITRDITERKVTENELILAKERAEESDRLKSAFLANLSHEIRTPMNGILGFSELLKDDEISSETRDHYVDIITKSGFHLLSIINDIIDISRIETKQVKLQVSSVNIDTLLLDLHDQFRFSIPKDKKLGLNIKCFESNEPVLINTDKTKLSQILSNLVSNAIKYTDKGEIIVWYELGENNLVHFHIKDSGIGIDKKDQKIIFERFRKIENDHGIRHGGAGLGLAISKAYAEMIGGSITVESAEREGSVFTVTIKNYKKAKPLNESSFPVAKKEQKSTMGEGCLLIVEDDEVNFQHISAVLNYNKLKHIRAINGKEAVDLCEENDSINLVLMDLKTPVMDGFEAKKRIRKINPELPIIALTAYALTEDVKQIKEAEFDGFLPKPIDKTKLIQLIQSYL
jgi:PAS domain S-box-containing protein